MTGGHERSSDESDKCGDSRCALVPPQRNDGHQHRGRGQRATANHDHDIESCHVLSDVIDRMKNIRRQKYGGRYAQPVKPNPSCRIHRNHRNHRNHP
jgi:hypothetical protein